MASTTKKEKRERADYDIVIAGGGPAGLTAAKELAGRGKCVLLLEKTVIGERPRSWIAWHEDIVKLGFGAAVINTIGTLVFRSFLGAEYNFNKCSSAIIDPVKLIGIMRRQAVKAGARIREKEGIIRYREEAGAVIAETGRGLYRAKYMIDASGAESVIQTGLSGSLPDKAYMGCYAVELSNLRIENASKALIFDAAFPGKNYFWMLPYSKTKALAGCFIFEKLNEKTMSRARKALMSYMKAEGIKGRREKTIIGNIPLGERLHLRYGRVFICGDAASSPLPSSGYGLLRAIREARLLAGCVASGFSKGEVKYEKAMISERFPGYELHYLVSDILRNINDPLLNKAINEMNDIDAGFIKNFLKGDDLSLGFATQALGAIFRTFTVQEIASMALNRDYKEFLLRFARVYPKSTPAVVKAAVKGFIEEIFGKKRRHR